MNRLRQRKLEARENRQASLHKQGMTIAEKPITRLPKPKNLPEKEIIKVSKKTVEVKRGRGRPRKTEQVSIKTVKGSNKKLAGKKEKK